MTQQTDRRDLKILALRESLAQIVTKYEDRDADRRIEITEAYEEIERLKDELKKLQDDENKKDVAE